MKEAADFGDSLRYGQLGEKLLAVIAAAYIKNGEGAVEVKTDRIVSTSQNVYIEFESRGRPSGIATSKAEYWAFILGGDRYRRDVIIIIKRQRLQKICERFGNRRIRGGDNDTSWGWNLPVATLLRPLSH